MSEQQNTQHKAILNMYGLFGASMILSIIPSLTAMILSLIFFSVLLVLSYGLRNKAEPQSLQENHAQYIVRTLWITALFSLVTTSLASIYMIRLLDYAPFSPCADGLLSQGAALENADGGQIYAQIEPCIEGFIAFNHTALINATLIAGLPLILYLGYRFTKGLGRAMKGYRLANPKSWL